ncbi:MAG: MBL fold metallo-hydrolase [Bryobacteraceae bacterium]
MKVTFYGAARTVTGSMHHLETGGRQYLLDCGIYQGRRKEAFARNSEFPFKPSAIDAIVLSHAHIDHSGNLPTIVKQGYGGPIYATSATVDLCAAMLADSAFLQEKDAEFLRKRRARRKSIGVQDGEAVGPLYTVEDATRAQQHFRVVEMHSPKEIGNGVRYTSYNAGHMLGSTSVVVEGEGIRLCFSGDVGRVRLPILRDPETMPKADYLIMESTYGDRFHQDAGPVKDRLAEIINRTCERGGKVIVPSFAVGRAQQLVLLLHQLILEKRVPSIPMFVDSPLAVNATEIFRKHKELYDAEAAKFLADGNDPFGFSRMRYIREANESKALNDLRGPMVIISASGMCEGGRILHHLRNTIEDPRNTVLITGFQAENTLGRKILEKQAEVPIFGEPMRLRAEVAKINELSGHADQRELIEWMKPMMPGLKGVFLVHGEMLQSTALKAAIQAEYPQLRVEQPARGDSFELTA